MLYQQAGKSSLVSRWRVEATIEEVAEILRDVERFPDWWSDVYLAVEILDEGGEDGIGRTAAVHTKGWLPYTLRWQGRVIEAQPPHRWAIEATGDLEGRGVWCLRQDDRVADITYQWQVSTQSRGLKLLAPVMRPVFAANHRWAMARGLEGLRLEIWRRRSI